MQTPGKLRTWIVTHFFPVGDPVKIVVRATGRNKAEKAAAELVYKFADYRVIGREFEVVA